MKNNDPLPNQLSLPHTHSLSGLANLQPAHLHLRGNKLQVPLRDRRTDRQLRQDAPASWFNVTTDHPTLDA